MTEAPVSKPDLKAALLVMCVECGDGIEAPFPVDHYALALLLAQRTWYMTVLTPPDQTPVVFGAVCTSCAPTVYRGDILKVVEERRQAFLAAAASKEVPR